MQGLSARLRNARLMVRDLEGIAALMMGSAFSERQVKDLRQKALEAPALPPREVLDALTFYEKDDSPAPHPPGVGAWVGQVANARDYLTDVCFVITAADGTSTFLSFLWATQQPRLVAFQELFPVQRPLDRAMMQGADTWRDAVARFADHTFTCKPRRYVFSDSLADAPAERVAVIPNLLRLEDGFAVTWSKACPLLDYLEEFPSKERGGGAAVERAPGRAQGRVLLREDEELALQYPGLAFLLARKVGAEPEVADEGEADDEEEHEEVAPIDVEEVFATLASKREELLRYVPMVTTDFVWELRGSRAGAAATGTPWDYTRARYSGGQVRHFCQRYGWQYTKDFRTVDYGERSAAALARAYCEKMQALYDIWLFSGRRLYRFTEEDYANAMPSAESVAKAEEAAPRGALAGVQLALQEINDFRLGEPRRM